MGAMPQSGSNRRQRKEVATIPLESVALDMEFLTTVVYRMRISLNGSYIDKVRIGPARWPFFPTTILVYLAFSVLSSFCISLLLRDSIRK